MPATPKRPHILTLLPVVFMVAGLVCLAVAGWGRVVPTLHPPQAIAAPAGAAIASAAVSRVGLDSLLPAPASPADPPATPPAPAGDNNLPLWVGLGALGLLLVLEGGALALDARQAR
jgi:hypothetical protein